MHVEYPTLELVVAGRRIGAAERPGAPVVDPATGDVLGEVPHATPADVDEAIAAAAEGFERWRRVPAPERGRVLRRAADAIRARREQLGRSCWCRWPRG